LRHAAAGGKQTEDGAEEQGAFHENAGR
jgi:hypothetical protein